MTWCGANPHILPHIALKATVATNPNVLMAPVILAEQRPSNAFGNTSMTCPIEAVAAAPAVYQDIHIYNI